MFKGLFILEMAKWTLFVIYANTLVSHCSKAVLLQHVADLFHAVGILSRRS